MAQILPASGFMQSFTRTQGEIKQGFEDIITGIKQGERNVPFELTITAGAVTPTADRSVYLIDTEADAATDNLTNMDPTGIYGEGSTIIIRAEDDGRTVVVTDLSGGAGEFSMFDGADATLDNVLKYIAFILEGTVWHELHRSF